MKKITAVVTALTVSLALFSACGASDEGGSTESAVYTEITSSAEVTEMTTASETADNTEVSVTETSAAEAAPLCADIANEIIGSVEMSSMAEVEADRVSLYLDCELPQNCDFSMFICGSGGFADEVFVLNAGDNDISGVIAAVESRIASRMKDFESYNPDEFEKLGEYFSAEKNGYFIYTVTADNDTCESIFEKYVK